MKYSSQLGCFAYYMNSSSRIKNTFLQKISVHVNNKINNDNIKVKQLSQKKHILKICMSIHKLV